MALLQRCGPTELSGVSGEFTSPGYPDRYPTDLACDYRIQVESGYAVRLMFTAFLLQGRTHGTCADSVQIFDGNGDSLSILRCSTEVNVVNSREPTIYNSLYNNMTLRFRAGWSNPTSRHRYRFKATWTRVIAVSQWAAWGWWSRCSVTCAGEGSRLRSRSCNVGQGQGCPGSDVDRGTCNNGDCRPAISYLTTWGMWSHCSVSCDGEGGRSRTRTCIRGEDEGEGCAWSRRIERGTCNNGACLVPDPIDFSGCGIRPNGDEMSTVSGIRISKRIIGGNRSHVGSWPFICLIKDTPVTRRAGYSCAGTLVRNRQGRFYLITAAHCVNETVGAQQYTVHCAVHYPGYSNDRINVTRVVTHIPYQEGKNDIAILELDPNRRQTYNVHAACIANEEVIPDGDAVLLGWGTGEGVFAPELQEAMVKIKNDRECGYPFSASTMICAGTVGGARSCTGDSGGPLLTLRRGRWYLSGVVSALTNPTHTCETPDWPNVYMDVYAYRNWINRQIN